MAYLCCQKDQCSVNLYCLNGVLDPEQNKLQPLKHEECHHRRGLSGRIDLLAPQNHLMSGPTDAMFHHSYGGQYLELGGTKKVSTCALLCHLSATTCLFALRVRADGEVPIYRT